MVESAPMSRRTRLGIALAATALGLGVLGDALFQGQPLGLNVPLWALVFTVALAVLLRAGRVPLHQGRRFMVAPLVLFAALLVWHDSPLLVAANLLAIAAAVSVGALRNIRTATLTEFGEGFVGAARSTAVGSLSLLMADIRWAELAGRGRSDTDRRRVGVACGRAAARPPFRPRTVGAGAVRAPPPRRRAARDLRRARVPRPAVPGVRRRAVPLPVRRQRARPVPGAPDVCRVRPPRLLRTGRGRRTDAIRSAAGRLGARRSRAACVPVVGGSPARPARNRHRVRTSADAPVRPALRPDGAPAVRDGRDSLARRGVGVVRADGSAREAPRVRRGR